jgi:hypothetical protein
VKIGGHDHSPFLSLTRSCPEGTGSTGGALSIDAAAILAGAFRNGVGARYDLFLAAIRRAYTRGDGLSGDSAAATLKNA